MRRHASVEVEWRQCDNEEAWKAAIVSPLAHVPHKSASVATGGGRRVRWQVSSAVILVLAALLAGGWRLYQADQVIARVENDVRAAVAADNTSSTSAGSEIAQGPGPVARRVEVQGDFAMVEVWTAESDIPWLPAPYRQTRFYRETEQGWQPADPVEVFWQPSNTLNMGRFTFVYGRRDRNAVLATSHQIEQLDAGLRAELGLPAGSEPLTIKLVTTGLPRLDPTVLARWSDGSVLYVPSPALMPLPDDVSEAEALLQLVAGLLAQRAVDEALAGSPQACEWRGLADGVQRWLLWERSELPSQDRYNGAQFFQDYVARYGLSRAVSMRPNRDACDSDPYARKLRTNYIVDSMAMASVEYAVFAYGRDRLPALLAGMHHATTWEDLVQGVYGVNTADFEAGWRDYLQGEKGGRVRAAAVKKASVLVRGHPSSSCRYPAG